jgi:hypothetical protein
VGEGQPWQKVIKILIQLKLGMVVHDCISSYMGGGGDVKKTLGKKYKTLSK